MCARRFCRFKSNQHGCSATELQPSGRLVGAAKAACPCGVANGEWLGRIASFLPMELCERSHRSLDESLEKVFMVGVQALLMSKLTQDWLVLQAVFHLECMGYWPWQKNSLTVGLGTTHCCVSCANSKVGIAGTATLYVAEQTGVAQSLMAFSRGIGMITGPLVMSKILGKLKLG